MSFHLLENGVDYVGAARQGIHDLLVDGALGEQVNVFDGPRLARAVDARQALFIRAEREAGILKGLTPRKRGPKSKRNPQEEELHKLRRENQRLTEELRKAEIIIDVQKKVAALLGPPTPATDPEEKP